MKLNLVKKQSAVLFFGILMSSLITAPSFANGVDRKYENSWQYISGSLTADDAAEERRVTGEWRLVDNYELFDVADGQSVSFYLKGGLDNLSGLCDPYLIVYDVEEPYAEYQDDDSGLGGAGDGYDGKTCEDDYEYDSFLTVVSWYSNYRVQVTAVSPVSEVSESDRTSLNKYTSGDYTLYVSVGNFGLTENSSDTAPWIGTQSITCPSPNPWVKEQLGFASNAKPVLVSAENTVGKTITQSSYDALKSSGVVFDTVSTKVSTATETLPIYGCKDKLLSGKVNQPIQFIAGGYTLQSEAHGYIYNTAQLKWHDTNGVTLYTNTAAFMHTIKFTNPGKYVVVLTEQPDTSRGLIPTYGVRSIRFVININ